MLMNAKEREARRHRIIRARQKGEAWVDIAIREHISRQRVRQIHDGMKMEVPNPNGEERRYSCRHCATRFKSESKFPPARCPNCGAYKWR